METVKFDLLGAYGHFKIPFSNNNPLTYSFITKTALIGLIGAVIGKERTEFKRLFPLLSDGLKYSLSINNELIKESISSYNINLNNYYEHRERVRKSPKPMEFIKNINWTVYLTCVSDNEEVKNIFENFVYNLQHRFYIWRPTLGIKQAPCEIKNVELGKVEKNDGMFITKTFIKEIIDIPIDAAVYKETIPTHQDDNWFNNPIYNVDVFFTDNSTPINSKGEYYKFNDENIVLI